MKYLKLITIIVALIAINNVNAQEFFAEYNSTYFNKINTINIDVETEYKYDLYVNMYSLDLNAETGGIIIDEKTNNNFINSLTLAKSKYVEWANVALTNKVDVARKKMDYSCIVDGYFLYGDEWHINRSIKLDYVFKIVETGPVLIVYTNKMISGSNEYIDHKGFAFVFQNVKEINDFINIMSQKSIDTHIKKPKSIDLFK